MIITDGQRKALKFAINAKPPSIAVAVISAALSSVLGGLILYRLLALKSFNPASGINIAAYVFAGLALAALAVLSISLVVRNQLVQDICKNRSELQSYMQDKALPRMSFFQSGKDKESVLGLREVGSNIDCAWNQFCNHTQAETLDDQSEADAIADEREVALRGLRHLKGTDQADLVHSALRSAASIGALSYKISSTVIETEALKYYATTSEVAYSLAYAPKESSNTPGNTWLDVPLPKSNPFSSGRTETIATKMFDALAEKAEISLNNAISS